MQVQATSAHGIEGAEIRHCNPCSQQRQVQLCRGSRRDMKHVSHQCAGYRLAFQYLVGGLPRSQKVGVQSPKGPKQEPQSHQQQARE